MERNGTNYPIVSKPLRRYSARNSICPECGGDLDVGWECNKCQYDAMDEAYPPDLRKRDESLFVKRP